MSISSAAPTTNTAERRKRVAFSPLIFIAGHAACWSGAAARSVRCATRGPHASSSSAARPTNGRDAPTAARARPRPAGRDRSRLPAQALAEARPRRRPRPGRGRHPARRRTWPSTDCSGATPWSANCCPTSPTASMFARDDALAAVVLATLSVWRHARTRGDLQHVVPAPAALRSATQRADEHCTRTVVRCPRDAGIAVASEFLAMQLLLLSNSRTGRHGLPRTRRWISARVPALRHPAVLFVPYAAITKTHYDIRGRGRPAFAAPRRRCHRHPSRARSRAGRARSAGHRSRRRQHLEPAARNARPSASCQPMRASACLPACLTSAGAPGTNVAWPTIMTTNDMPICDPGGFDALALVPFQINPHYLHGNPTASRARRARSGSASSACCIRARGSPGCARARASSSRIDRYGCWAMRSAASFADSGAS